MARVCEDGTMVIKPSSLNPRLLPMTLVSKRRKLFSISVTWVEFKTSVGVWFGFKKSGSDVRGNCAAAANGKTNRTEKRYFIANLRAEITVSRETRKWFCDLAKGNYDWSGK